MANDRVISAEELHQALAAAVRALAQCQVRYALIGGVATSYRSQPRFTKDLDFLLHVPALVLPRLLDSFQESGFAFDPQATIQEWTQHHMAVLDFKGIRIDWLKPVLPTYLHILDCATDEDWLGQTVRVASAEGLILLKLLAFRPQDQVDVQNLLAANRGKLDLDWIRSEWQTMMSLDDPRMQRFMEWASA